MYSQEVWPGVTHGRGGERSDGRWGRRGDGRLDGDRAPARAVALLHDGVRRAVALVRDAGDVLVGADLDDLSRGHRGRVEVVDLPVAAVDGDEVSIRRREHLAEADADVERREVLGLGGLEEGLELAVLDDERHDAEGARRGPLEDGRLVADDRPAAHGSTGLGVDLGDHGVAELGVVAADVQLLAVRLEAHVVDAHEAAEATDVGHAVADHLDELHAARTGDEEVGLSLRRLAGLAEGTVEALDHGLVGDALVDRRAGSDEDVAVGHEDAHVQTRRLAIEDEGLATGERPAGSVDDAVLPEGEGSDGLELGRRKITSVNEIHASSHGNPPKLSCSGTPRANGRHSTLS